MFKNIFYNTKNSQIHLWEQVNGEDFYDTIDWVPYLYEEDSNGQTHTIDGKLAQIKVFDHYRQYYNYQKECGYVLENKTKPEIQFLAERYHKIPDDEIQVPTLKIYTIDIEVDIDKGFPKPEDADAPICLISIKDYVSKNITTFGLQEYSGNRKVKYYQCNNERDLLTRFFTYIYKYSPDVITGWNIWSFDLPYIINRCKKIFERKRANLYKFLSPIKIVRTWDSKYGDMNIDIAGIDILDYYQLYKWYSPHNLESYRLDYVSKFELEKGKLDYSEYEDLRELMQKNWNKFVDYNIDDVNRVDDLEIKLGYIRLVQALSLLTKCPMKFYDAMTHLIEGAMLTYYRRNNLCAPYFAGGTQEGFEAAYVKDPQQGIHEWIIDIDITSSYPSHIITLNMSNETYLGKIIGIQEEVLMRYVREKNIPEFEFISHKKGLVKYNGKRLKKFNMAIKKGLIAVSPCGSCFSTREPGVISTVERNIFFKRKEVKQQMKDLRKNASTTKNKKEKEQKLERAQELFNFQWALKILLNAVFGVTSVPYSRYFNTNIAEAITSCGRYTIKQGQKFTNTLLNNPDERLKEILLEIGEIK